MTCTAAEDIGIVRPAVRARHDVIDNNGDADVGQIPALGAQPTERFGSKGRGAKTTPLSGWKSVGRMDNHAIQYLVWADRRLLPLSGPRLCL